MNNEELIAEGRRKVRVGCASNLEAKMTVALERLTETPPATGAAAMREAARLQGLIDCACNALTDSICASGNDAATNLHFVGKLRRDAIPPNPLPAPEVVKEDATEATLCALMNLDNLGACSGAVKAHPMFQITRMQLVAALEKMGSGDYPEAARPR
mgnify:CR=1 FL=1